MAISNARKAKNAGIYLQKMVVSKLLEKFPQLTEEDIVSCQASQGGEDIQLSNMARKTLPISIECKHVKSFPKTVMDWFKQAESNSGKYEPVVIAKKRGMRGEQPKVIINMNHYIDLLEKAYG